MGFVEGHRARDVAADPLDRYVCSGPAVAFDHYGAGKRNWSLPVGRLGGRALRRLDGQVHARRGTAAEAATGARFCPSPSTRRKLPALPTGESNAFRPRNQPNLLHSFASIKPVPAEYRAPSPASGTKPGLPDDAPSGIYDVAREIRLREFPRKAALRDASSTISSRIVTPSASCRRKASRASGVRTSLRPAQATNIIATTCHPFGAQIQSPVWQRRYIYAQSRIADNQRGIARGQHFFERRRMRRHHRMASITLGKNHPRQRHRRMHELDPTASVWMASKGRREISRMLRRGSWRAILARYRQKIEAEAVEFGAREQPDVGIAVAQRRRAVNGQIKPEIEQAAGSE